MFSNTAGSRFFIVVLALALTLASPAQAARLGGGRSTGMQRNQISRSVPAAPAQPPMQQPQQQRSALVPALAGAAVGAAAGYALAKNTDHASGTANNNGDGLPWGWLIALGLLTWAGFMFLRRRERPVANPYPEVRPAPGGNTLTQPAMLGQKIYRIGEGALPSGQPPPVTLPDGTDTQAFLRQAKASFQHLQAMNSPAQLEELRKYLTPELFTALRAEIEENRETADFPVLNVDLQGTSDETGQIVASVRFYGQVSEFLNAPLASFEEVWHFTKQKVSAAHWLLAGIEQSH